MDKIPGAGRPASLSASLSARIEGCPFVVPLRRDLLGCQLPSDEEIHSLDHLFPRFALCRILEHRSVLGTEA